MNAPTRGGRGRLLLALVPWVVLGAGIGASWLVSRTLARQEEAARVNLLATGLAQAMEGLRHRLDEVEATMRSLAGLGAVEAEPTAGDWQEQVESVRALQRHGGIRFLAWIPAKADAPVRISPPARAEGVEEGLNGARPEEVQALLMEARRQSDGLARGYMDLPAAWGMPRSLLVAAQDAYAGRPRGWALAVLDPQEMLRGVLGNRPVAGLRFQILDRGAVGSRSVIFSAEEGVREPLAAVEGSLREAEVPMGRTPWVVRVALASEPEAWPLARRALAGGLATTLACFLLTLLLARAHTRLEDLAVRPQESEDGFRAMTEAASCMIIIYADQLEYINRAGAEILGWRPEEMVGHNRLDFVHPLDREWVAARWEARRRGEEVPNHYEFRILNRLGETRWVDFSAATLTLRGRIYGLGTALDITERMTAHEERLQMERKLLDAQKLESLGLLAGGIAHDFNNLLAVIQGHAGILREELEASPLADESLSRIEETCSRAAELVRQMLAYSGRGRFQVKPMDLNRELEGVGHLLSVSLPKDVTLRHDLGADLPAVEADPSQVQQVVLNLVTNAAEAMLEGGGQITLRTGVTRLDRAAISELRAAEAMVPGRFVWLEVEDEGCGMDPATQARVFDPFFTTKFTGRGLGLAAMQGIVRSHQGGVRLESEPGEGTRFRVYFPSLESSLPEATLAQLQRAAYRGEGLVLVVDDEPAIRDLARTLLERVGFQVLLAGDGFEALDLFRHHHAELALVVMDLVMPRMGGVEAHTRMQELDGAVPMLLMSGFGHEDAVAELETQGKALFLPKPFGRQALLDAVARIARTVKA